MLIVIYLDVLDLDMLDDSLTLFLIKYSKTNVFNFNSNFKK